MWGAREVVNTGRAIIRIKLGRGHIAKSIGIVIAIVIAALVVIKSQRTKRKKEDETEEEI
jgi:hypothetical protein